MTEVESGESKNPVVPVPEWYRLPTEQKIQLLGRKTCYSQRPRILSDKEMTAMVSARVLEKAS